MNADQFATSDFESGRQKTILCVEDETDLRSDIVEELVSAGYRVIEAGNGREALLELEAARPDLILCDITMPELGGYELMARLRADRPDLAEVPFVFLTALADRVEVLNGKNAGADDYLVKPVDFDDLLATIKSRLRLVDRIRLSLLADLQREQQQLIEQAVREGEITLAALAAALDHVSIGIFLLDETGEVRMTNEAGRHLISEGDGLSLTATRLYARAAKTSQPLKSVLAAVLQEAGNSHTIAVEREEGHPLVLQLSSIRLPDCNSPHAIVFVVDPDKQPYISPEVLAPLFGCTAAEAKLAAALVAGKRLEEIGEEFGVKPSTITFHLQNLFQKTHTHRQTDLVALLIRATVPLSLSN
ncbi:DNA-binding NarL/FixJ family response regulator [Mycoplana sp. BE70]|uniref:response regulator n=1 Tax=Mycoplana sp. BE70 TaxID=2817775 RepID=UPI0028668A08|nr:response regulator [Mycoplana sp. BE70]MDR6759241.1 DNA-binding NarL/FixJ family response regulator [Mycoplana sp. BE70]